MTPHTSRDSLLLLLTALAVAFLLFLILYWKLHAFFALLFTSIALGLLAGMPPQSIVGSLLKGMADLLGSTAVIVGVGAMMGRLIEISRGGEVIAQRIISGAGKEKAAWAMLLVAYLVGIPVFFDVAFMTLMPLVWNLGKETKKSQLVFALPLLAALTATHGLIPTHPGPAAATGLLGASFGETVLFGLLIAIPMSIVGGMGCAKWIGGRMFIPAPERLMPKTEGASQSITRLPSVSSVLIVLLLPVVLMGLAAVAPAILAKGSAVSVCATFIGSPLIALLIATGAGLVLLGTNLGFNGKSLMRHTNDALNSVGSLILIIGASGAFKQIIIDSGAGSSFDKFMLSTRIPPLIIAFLIAAALRFALGSATAAIATAAGIVAPMIAVFPHVNRALLVMAVGAGGSFISHVNDSGFWMVQDYCGMSVSETLKSYTVMKVVTSLAGLASILVLARFV